MSESKKEKLKTLKAQIKSTKSEIATFEKNRLSSLSPSKSSLSAFSTESGLPNFPCNLKLRRTLKGHFGKVYAHSWANDSRHIVSASQDGKLLVWDALSQNKINAITLRSNWVMTCAFSPSSKLIACGGLDNVCSIFRNNVSEDFRFEDTVPEAELVKHAGYLSCAKFLDEANILTASGDGTVVHWDVEKKAPIRTFDEHEGDVMSISLGDDRLFVTGSCDTTARLYDLREDKGNVFCYEGHRADINSVHYIDGMRTFISGSDDGTCRMWDLRSNSSIQTYAHEEKSSCVVGVTASKSGRLVMASLDDKACLVWDSLTGEKVQTLVGHDKRVSMLSVSPAGTCLCTASWDRTLKIWA